MNDRLRFRAWVVGHYFSENDEEKEILLKLNDVTVYNDGLIGIDYHSLLESVCGFLTNEGERESLIECFEDKNFTTGDDWYYLEAKSIEQCTGLKDKNGRLIYEGDIVKQDDEVFIVKWSDEDVASCGCCIPRFSGVGFICENSFGRGDLDRDIEVIGNIHENSDLLEAEKAYSAETE